MSRSERFASRKNKPRATSASTPTDPDIISLLDQKFGPQPAATTERFTRALPESTVVPEPEARRTEPSRRIVEPPPIRATPPRHETSSDWDQPPERPEIPRSLRQFDSNRNGRLEDSEHLEAMDHGAYKKPSPKLQQLLTQFEELGFDPDELQAELLTQNDEEEQIETAQNAILNGMLEKIEQSGQNVDDLQEKVEEIDDFEDRVHFLEQYLTNQPAKPPGKTKAPKKPTKISRRLVIRGGLAAIGLTALGAAGYAVRNMLGDSPTSTAPTSTSDFPPIAPTPATEMTRTPENNQNITVTTNPIPENLRHNVEAFIDLLGNEITLPPGETVSLLTRAGLDIEDAWKAKFNSVDGFFGRGPFVPITLISQAAAQTNGLVTVQALPLITPPPEYLAIFQSANPTLSSIQLPADHDLSQDATITNTGSQTQTIRLEYQPDHTVRVTITDN